MSLIPNAGEEEKIAGRVRSFLQKNVPPFGLSITEVWRSEARSLGVEAAPLLIDALQNGSEAQQYSALLALRENGFEAWGHGYNADFEYHVTIDGMKQIIKPKHYDIIE